jgi:hypothetical protein
MGKLHVRSDADNFEDEAHDGMQAIEIWRAVSAQYSDNRCPIMVKAVW